MPPVLTLAAAGVELGGREVVHDINLTLEAGQTLAILGPNGAGKTVLLRALLGLSPYQGAITWAEGTRIGYVPQRAEADRHLPLNIGNLLAAKAAVQHLPATTMAGILGAVGLEPSALSTPVGVLSGGQFQRALMAFALLGSPNVLLLDEPTASIDEPGEERLYEMLHRLQGEATLTVVLVSHDLSFVYAYADRVLCMNRTALCVGAPRDVLTPAAMEQLFGGPTKFYHTDHLHHA